MVAVLYFLISWSLMQALEYLERSPTPSTGAEGGRAMIRVEHLSKTSATSPC